jgi:hypothetical protein
MLENGHKETDKISIKLRNLGTVNKNEVIITKNHRQVCLTFSYETIVAVDDIVTKNNWSVTTGKLLNQLEPDHKARVPHEEVLKEADKRIKEVLYGV